MATRTEAQREATRRWFALRPDYARDYYEANRERYRTYKDAAKSPAARLRRAKMPCRYEGCDQPRHVTPGGSVSAVCRDHRNERARETYFARTGKEPRVWLDICCEEGCSRARRRFPGGSMSTRCPSHHDAAKPGMDRGYFLRTRGLTESRYQQMLASQGGQCAICGATEPGGRGTWSVDHDHRCCPQHPSRTTPWCGHCVRGLLCMACNVGIGFLKDDPRLLESAAIYLRGVAVDGAA
jgi:Recombination endonuclease VII